MRLDCPFCGERDSSEFAYLGDGSVSRPSPDSPDAAAEFVEAVYYRDNPAGSHTELWYHGFGCRSWVRVQRDTRTHEVLGTALSRAAAR
ncbi:MAG: sarcosine oxidase subunit delta [Actinomycetota bacterium]